MGSADRVAIEPARVTAVTNDAGEITEYLIDCTDHEADAILRAVSALRRSRSDHERAMAAMDLSYAKWRRQQEQSG